MRIARESVGKCLKMFRRFGSCVTLIYLLAGGGSVPRCTLRLCFWKFPQNASVFCCPEGLGLGFGEERAAVITSSTRVARYFGEFGLRLHIVVCMGFIGV